MTHKINKSDEEWREQLTPKQYEVARQKGTEPPFDNKYWNEKRKGVYHCACCDEALFASDTKYDSGTGWPSFYAPLNDGDIEIEEDAGHGMIRSEVHCGKCGAHLGHVFDDGPMPTGLRYCLNSASLDLKEKTGDEA